MQTRGADRHVSYGSAAVAIVNDNTDPTAELSVAREVNRAIHIVEAAGGVRVVVADSDLRILCPDEC